MFKPKKKILFVSESIFATTGYGTLYKELLTRLHSLNKYRIAEFASFAGVNDPRDFETKWRFYANEPSPNDHASRAKYNASDSNKTGHYRFDEVLLDFEPDTVIDIRDTTFFEYQALSSLKKFFSWIICPSADSHPQMSNWLSTHLQADSVLTYTRYAYDMLKNEGGGKIKLSKVAYPGIPQVFKPLPNKNQLRQFFGIDQNAFIVGMNGRNQIRKLFIEMLKAYKIFLDKLKNVDQNTYNNTFLYLHCSFPDLKTWNIPKALVQFGLANKVLFTYNCTKCGKFFPNRFQEVLSTCRFCGGQAILPRINFNINQESLNQVYNLMDVYVQYANAGALEFPLTEAAGAGCNVMAINYAGTGDVCQRLGGICLEPLGIPRDINVDADRAIPNNELLANELMKFAVRPRQINLRNGIKQSELAKKKFSWDKNAEIWEKVIDNTPLVGLQGKWGTRLDYQPRPVSDNLNIADWTYAMLEYALQEPGLKHTLFIDDMIKYAEVGLRSTGATVIGWSRNEIKKTIENLIQAKLFAESVRNGHMSLDYNQDWLKYAEIKELSNI